MFTKIITLVGVLFVAQLHAHDLKGTVVDSDNTPIEGVGIYNSTTQGYTYTNVSSYFELDDISIDDVISFYSLGFETQQLIITEAYLDGTAQIVLEKAPVSLDQVILVSQLNALSSFVDVDIKTNPIKSSQEILRKVPGLIIGQHAGGGKAEQIFLRGFDIDHGTDISLKVDGMPVNMVSHAHGQGYADMHFVIPETIENIDFGKGPYYADEGNFNTAGYVNLATKKTIDENLISVEAGQFETFRTLGMLKFLERKNHDAYLASELVLTDGFFDSPQNFNRLNLMGRYHYTNEDNQEFSVGLSHFQSKWDASGQIPQRAVDQGIIGRFGAIDDTEGGNTSRSNLWLNHTKQIDEHRKVTSNAYFTHYDFELYSNFTFFLNDPVNRDQIKQYEDRRVMGAQSEYEHMLHYGDHDTQVKYNVGAGFRYDDVNDVELSRTVNRDTVLSRLALGNIDEVNAFGFLSLNYKKDKWSFHPALRLDYFRMDYENKLTTVYDNQSETKLRLSPKLNILYAPSSKLQLFAKTGMGFHSNDTRVVVAQNGEDILPIAVGGDLGFISKPANGLLINFALWGLWLEQEFVYVGDEAIVEPSGKTQRYGVDVGVRYEFNDWLSIYTDVNYTHARSTESPDGEDYIPLAPDLTSTGGVTLRNLGGLSGGMNYRFIKDRPANEDNSIVAEGYFVTDFNLNYTIGNWTAGIIVENLFDTEWNETQFATESRLMNEPTPVEEIHFTPGTPFFIRGKLSVRF